MNALPPAAEDGYGALERRVRRRLGGGGAAAALVARCRERCVTAGVVADFTCEELAEELGVSAAAARALRLDDAAWAAFESNTGQTLVQK